MKHHKRNQINENRINWIRNKKGELVTQVKFWPKFLKWKDHLENLDVFIYLHFMVYVTALIEAQPI